MRQNGFMRRSHLSVLVYCLMLIAGCIAVPSEKEQVAVVYPQVVSTHPLRQPEYPDASRRRGDQGLVGIDVLVGEDGRVKDAKIVMSSGYEALDASTLKEARTWRFAPGRLNGRPAAMWNTFTITFSLYDTARPMPDQARAVAEMWRMSEQRRAALEAEAAAK